MMDVFRKAFLAGMGAMSLSSERAVKLVNELIEAGELREKEGRGLLDEMVKKAGEMKREVESTISKQLDTAYKRLNLVSLDQLKKMESRVQELETKLSQAPRAARSAKTAAASSGRTGKRAAGKKKREIVSRGVTGYPEGDTPFRSRIHADRDTPITGRFGS